MKARIALDPGLLRTALTREASDGLADLVADAIFDQTETTPQRRTVPWARWWRWADARTNFGDAGFASRRTWLVAMVALLAALASIAIGATHLVRDPLPGNGFLAVGPVNGRVLLVDPDGLTTEPVETSGGDLLSWSPDGSRLAFLTTHAGGWRIHLRDAASGDTSIAIERAYTEQIHPFDLAWSPDGRLLAMVADYDGVSKLFIVDIERQTMRRIGPDDGNTKVEGGRWSPDGQRLAFSAALGPWSTKFALYVSPADGRGYMQVPMRLAPDETIDSGPEWFPDSRSLLVTVRSRAGRWQLYRVNVETGATSPIGPGTTMWRGGLPSPDGRWIREVSWHAYGEGGNLFAMRIDGSDRRPLATGVCPSADWSPDGSLIVYEMGGCSRQSRSTQIRTIGPDGTGDRVVWESSARMYGGLSLAWQARPAH